MKRVFGVGENYDAHRFEGAQRHCVDCGDEIGNGTRCDDCREGER